MNKDTNDEDKKNIVHFPDRAQQKQREKNKKKEEKQRSKGEKQQQKLEDKYRADYRKERAERAQMQARMAQGKGTDKQPFINFDRIPIFTRIIVAVILVIQICMSFIVTDVQKVEILYHLAFIPGKFTGATDFTFSALISPLSSLFFHGGWMHLLFNVVMMLAMGVFFERQYGAKHTLGFFLLCGAIGNLFYLLINPFSTVPVIGASGAISGLFAVTIMLMTERGFMGPEAQKRGAFPFIIFWSTVIIALGFFSSDTSWQSHLGGFWGGAGLYLLWKKNGFRP